MENGFELSNAANHIFLIYRCECEKYSLSTDVRENEREKQAEREREREIKKRFKSNYVIDKGWLQSVKGYNRLFDEEAKKAKRLLSGNKIKMKKV